MTTNRTDATKLTDAYSPSRRSAIDVELRRRGHTVQRELWVEIVYDGVPIAQNRIDVLVDHRLIVEVKASEKLHKDAARQVFNYLRATDLEVGLLLHFGREPHFYRVVCEPRFKGPRRAPDASTKGSPDESTERGTTNRTDETDLTEGVFL